MSTKKDGSKSRELLSIIGAALAIGLVLANIHSIFGLLSSVFPIGTTGIVKSANINIYWERGCVNNVTSIGWGLLEPNSSKTVTIYIKNTGNVALTLNLSAENWNPESAKTYLALAWNYSGGTIQPNEVTPVALTLTISENTQGVTGFRFDILVTGTEVTEGG